MRRGAASCWIRQGVEPRPFFCDSWALPPPLTKDPHLNASTFDRLGFNSTRWQWRLRRWRRNVQSFCSDLRHPGRPSVLITKGLIMANLLFFSVMVLQGAAAGLGMRPLFSPDPYLLIHSGAQYWPLVLSEGQWWRCLSYAFTHGGLIHLAFNMLVLYQVGPMLEFELGSARYFFLYTVTALTATVAGYLWHPAVPVVGASGSLFGLIGFSVVYFHRLGDHAALQHRNFMFQWAVYAFIFGLLVGADNAGHLGGALGGAVIGLLIPVSIRGRRATTPLFNLLATLSLMAILYSLGMLVLSWFRT